VAGGEVLMGRFWHRGDGDSRRQLGTEGAVDLGCKPFEPFVQGPDEGFSLSNTLASKLKSTKPAADLAHANMNSEYACDSSFACSMNIDS